MRRLAPQPGILATVRAISVHPTVAWATIHAGLQLPPAGDGVILLHVGRQVILAPELSRRLASIAPGGPRELPRGHLVGIVRAARLRVVAAWPLPHVRHLGSVTTFAVDPEALGTHRAAYEAAWEQMVADLRTSVCSACRDLECEGTCLLGSASLTERLGAPTLITQR